MAQKLWQNRLYLMLLGGVICLAVILLRQRQESPPPQIYHIGILSGAPLFDGTIDSFRAELAAQGYIEGVHVIYIQQSAVGDADAMERICREFVAQEVDLIFTTTNGAALAAKNATQTIPVIFTYVVAPVENGIVANRRQPHGNVTGVENPLSDYAGKRLELLRELQPTIRRVFVPYNPHYPTIPAVLAELRQIAPLLGLELVELPVTNPVEVTVYLGALDEPPFEAIFIMPDLTVQHPAAWLAMLAFSQEHDLLVVGNTQQQVQEGALYSYLPDDTATGQQAAQMAKQILMGISPSDVSVEAAEIYLIFNLRVARLLNLGISDTFLERAHLILR